MSVNSILSFRLFSIWIVHRLRFSIIKWLPLTQYSMYVVCTHTYSTHKKLIHFSAKKIYHRHTFIAPTIRIKKILLCGICVRCGNILNNYHFSNLFFYFVLHAVLIHTQTFVLDRSVWRVYFSIKPISFSIDSYA